MKNLLPLLGVALLAGCGADKSGAPEITAKTITANNFEGGGGWSNDPGRNNPSLIARGNAHSGQFAAVVDKDHEFSITYDMALGQIRASKFRLVHFNAWVFLASDKSTANIGLQVMDPVTNQQIYSDDIKLQDAVKKYNTWVEVNKDFTLPEDVTFGQHMRLFVWRASATDAVLLDDVSMTIMD